MMSRPLECDYVDSSEISSGKACDEPLIFSSQRGKTRSLFNLKETELRLGPPGSESTERKHRENGVPHLGDNLELEGHHRNVYSVGSSATGLPKKGFSDAVVDCGKWVLSVNAGFEVIEGNGGIIFSGLESKSTFKEVALLSSPKPFQEKQPQISASGPPAKAQVVGWPPIRSFRKNTVASTSAKQDDGTEGNSGSRCLYVKVGMDGAPYLRKVDLKTYSNYMELSTALEKMFSSFLIGQYGSGGVLGCDGPRKSRLSDLLSSSDYVLTYEDKDGDWMLVGDVPWKMFMDACKRLRIMKGSEATRLAPRATE
ncbi:hypothetical protein Ancab_029516 [Ancistrocladus abbreviatus]